MWQKAEGLLDQAAVPDAIDVLGPNFEMLPSWSLGTQGGGAWDPPIHFQTELDMLETVF